MPNDISVNKRVTIISVTRSPLYVPQVNETGKPVERHFFYILTLLLKQRGNLKKLLSLQHCMAVIKQTKFCAKFINIWHLTIILNFNNLFSKFEAILISEGKILINPFLCTESCKLRQLFPFSSSKNPKS